MGHRRALSPSDNRIHDRTDVPVPEGSGSLGTSRTDEVDSLREPSFRCLHRTPKDYSTLRNKRDNTKVLQWTQGEYPNLDRCSDPRDPRGRDGVYRGRGDTLGFVYEQWVSFTTSDSGSRPRWGRRTVFDGPCYVSSGRGMGLLSPPTSVTRTVPSQTPGPSITRTSRHGGPVTDRDTTRNWGTPPVEKDFGNSWS